MACEVQPPRSYGEPSRSFRSPRLLVVEDDEDLRAIFGRVIESIDPKLVLDWAPDAEGAISRLRTFRYAAVLADYLLPGGVTGLGIRPYTRRNQPEAAFAMMSAYPVRDFMRAARGEPFPILRKPFTPAECRRFLKALLPPPER